MAKSFTVVDNSWDFALMYTKWSGFPGQLYLGFSYISVGSVEEMVSKLIARTGSELIESLFIVGHGGSGRQAVGCGRGTGDDNGDKSLKYDVGAYGYELLGGAKKHLRRLRNKFTDDAVISLGGCAVAEGEEGKKLLSLISYETNTFVEAGDTAQNPLLPGWEGNVVRCYHDTHWIAKAKW